MVKTAILLGMLASVASSDPQDALDKYRTEMANMPAVSPPSPSDAALSSAIAQWKALQQTDALPFDSYATFLMAHPGWPGETGMRRAAERQAGSASPSNVVAYFRRFPPQSASGAVAAARAYQALGDGAAANAAARRAWRMASLTPADEQYLLTAFGTTLTADDHDARVDALLWQGQTSAAARDIAYGTSLRRPILTARLAFRTNAPEAAGYAANPPAGAAGDPGFIADRALWLRGSGADAMRQALASAHPETQPGSPAAWLDLLLAQAKAAAGDGDWQSAYDIARLAEVTYPFGTEIGERPYGERDDYTSLVWLGGQAALKHLGRPADAMTLFDMYARGSRTPSVRSKGYYWASRAAEAAGRSFEAATYLTQAAGYRDQFYGQLALERAGRALTPPPSIATVTADPAVRAAYLQRETVRAATFLGRIGDHDDQTLFLRQIAIDAKSDSDHLLGAELALSLGRPDLGVMIGRSALTNGLSDYSAAGFPMVPVPTGYERSWTVIHAISRQESQFDRAAVSHAGARGLMQLMPGTAREQSGKIGMAYNAASLTTDPGLSMMLGSSYFDRIYQQFGSYPLAIAAYNAGGGNVNKWLAANGDPRTGQVDMVDWIEAIPFTETRGYVQRVLENAVVYDLLDPARGLSAGHQAPLSWYLGKGRPG